LTIVRARSRAFLVRLPPGYDWLIRDFGLWRSLERTWLGATSEHSRHSPTPPMPPSNPQATVDQHQEYPTLRSTGVHRLAPPGPLGAKRTKQSHVQ